MTDDDIFQYTRKYKSSRRLEISRMSPCRRRRHEIETFFQFENSRQTFVKFPAATVILSPRRCK
jgi:hypothetical protein